MDVELLYNSVKTRSQTVRDRTELETRCGKESHTRPKGLGVLMSWGPEKLLIRCGRESPADGGPWSP